MKSPWNVILTLRVVLASTLWWQAGCAETNSLQFAPPSRLQPAQPVSRPIIYKAAQHRVVRVRDGDSLTLDSDQVLHEVRLAGIDAPELRQDLGGAAKEALAALVQGREISFRDSGQDQYHRNLVRLYADGLDVNCEMIRRGLAWWYRAYSNDPALEAAEQEARRFRRGVWAQPNPQPPWEWRRANGRAFSRSGE